MIQYITNNAIKKQYGLIEICFLIYLQDDHVLNYSEIVFSPSEGPRFLIHGSNNKTVYADVDLSVKAVALPYTDDESSDDNTSDFDDVSSWVKTKVESDQRQASKMKIKFINTSCMPLLAVPK